MRLVSLLSFAPARAQDKKDDTGEIVVTGRTEGAVTEPNPKGDPTAGLVVRVRLRVAHKADR